MLAICFFAQGGEYTEELFLKGGKGVSPRTHGPCFHSGCPRHSLVNRINILLVEDHMIVREGLRRLLESDKDFTVIGEASNGREALALAIELSPDVVLMDIEMPSGNGFEAIRRILKFLL